MTDTGMVPKQMPKISPNTYGLVESNYDWPLMDLSNQVCQRTISDVGHLSINQAKEFIDNNSFVWVGLIHGSQRNLNDQSDSIYEKLDHVERVINGWERHWK